jgi:hypothetical protein
LGTPICSGVTHCSLLVLSTNASSSDIYFLNKFLWRPRITYSSIVSSIFLWLSSNSGVFSPP